MKTGYKQCPCQTCTRTPNPDWCPQYRSCAEYRKWLDKAWHDAGGKKTPGGIGVIEKNAPVAWKGKERLCSICGKPIPKGSRRRNYCSEVCAARGANKRLQEMNRKCYLDD